MTSSTSMTWTAAKIASKIAAMPQTNAPTDLTAAVRRMATSMGSWNIDAAERAALEALTPSQKVASFVRARQSLRQSLETVSLLASNASSGASTSASSGLATACLDMGKSLSKTTKLFELIAGSGRFKMEVMTALATQSIKGSEWRESGVQVQGAPAAAGADITIPACDGAAIDPAASSSGWTLRSNLLDQNMSPGFKSDEDDYLEHDLPPNEREVSQPCDNNSQCYTRACDTEGVFGCKGLCVKLLRSPYKGANFNCPGAFF